LFRSEASAFLVRPGEGQFEFGALVDLALNVNRTAVFLNDPIRNSQAQPRTTTDLFCSKERIKYLAEIFRWYALSRVGNFDRNAAILGKCV